MFTLSAQNHDTWVKVRDGETQYSTLLLNQMGGHIPNAVRSTGNKMMVEFLAPYVSSGTGYVQNTEGFVAVYSAVGKYGAVCVFMHSETNNFEMHEWWNDQIG